MAHENLLLENQLCHSLYVATNAVTRAYRAQLAELNLTYPQYLVLLTLWDLEQATVSDIARVMQVESATLTPLLKRMEINGLVTRQRDPEDERRVIVQATQPARNMRRKLAKIQENVACSTGLDEAAFKRLRKTLLELADTVNRARDPEKRPMLGRA